MFSDIISTVGVFTSIIKFKEVIFDRSI